MNQFILSKQRLQTGVCVSIAVIALYAVRPGRVFAAESKPAKAAKMDKKEQKKSKKLNGADLYALHCNRCHPERYAPERTAEHWKTILTHMRVRANLPAEQAREILKFLQEDSGK